MFVFKSSVSAHDLPSIPPSSAPAMNCSRSCKNHLPTSRNGCHKLMFLLRWSVKRVQKRAILSLCQLSQVLLPTQVCCARKMSAPCSTLTRSFGYIFTRCVSINNISPIFSFRIILPNLIFLTMRFVNWPRKSIIVVK